MTEAHETELKKLRDAIDEDVSAQQQTKEGEAAREAAHEAARHVAHLPSGRAPQLLHGGFCGEPPRARYVGPGDWTQLRT